MKTWKELIKDLLEVEKIKEGYSNVLVRRKVAKVTPEHKDIFKAFTLCPVDKLKVVILRDSPNLPVIIKWLKLSNVANTFETTSTDWWMKQGVLILDISLTTEGNKSHKAYWINFIAKVMIYINSLDKRIAWLVMSDDAHVLKTRFLTNADQCKITFIDPDYNPFIETNNFLKWTKQTPIDWNLYNVEPFPVEWNQN